MTDIEQLRTEFDQLRQTLQSDPSAAAVFASLRGIPQVIHRGWSGAAFSGLNNDWARIFTYEGKGGLLYPDRTLDVQIFLTTNGPVPGDPRPYSIRYTLNGTTIYQRDSSGLIAPTLTEDLRLRIMALGSNYSQYVFPGTAFSRIDGAGTFQLDLASSWELGVDFLWVENDFNTVVTVDNDLIILW